MFKDFFASADFMTLPLVTLILFIAVFLSVVVWTFSKKRKPHYDHMSRMPLEGATNEYETQHDSSHEEVR